MNGFCSIYYKSNSLFISPEALHQKTENQLQVKLENNKSPEVVIVLPEEFSSSLQIELHGENSRRYLISSLITETGQRLINDSIPKSQNLELALQKIDNFMPGTDGFRTSVATYSSKIRSVPSTEAGYTSILIPAKYLKTKKGRKLLILKAITDGNEKPHSIEIRAISSGSHSNLKQKQVLNLNLFIPEGLKESLSNELLEALIDKVNLIYSAANIHIVVNSLNKVSSLWDVINVDKLSVKDFYDFSKDSPYGLNIVLTKSLMSSQMGTIGGYSYALTGPSSVQGVKKSGILLGVPIVPKKNSPNEIENWSIELANYLGHEIGHYLSLYHTYELRSYDLVDHFKDTPETASDNLMNPETHRGELQSLSPEQVMGIRQHPLLEFVK